MNSVSVRHIFVFIYGLFNDFVSSINYRVNGSLLNYIEGDDSGSNFVRPFLTLRDPLSMRTIMAPLREIFTQRILGLYSSVVLYIPFPSTCYNSAFYPQSVFVFHTVLKIKSCCFPKQYQPAGPCSGYLMCFL
jgi:hypothetical protein